MVISEAELTVSLAAVDLYHRQQGKDEIKAGWKLSYCMADLTLSHQFCLQIRPEVLKEGEHNSVHPIMTTLAFDHLKHVARSVGQLLWACRGSLACSPDCELRGRATHVPLTLMAAGRLPD
jgi:hypothetical protein